MKENTDSQGEKHYFFRRDEVLSLDLQGFLQRYIPTRLTPFQLRNLFGRLTLEIEDVVKCGDIATIPETRKLIRTLHRGWPWVGFFLDLGQPFGSAEGLGRLPMLAFGFCLIDMTLSASDHTGQCTVSFAENDLLQFRDECFFTIDLLGHHAEIPVEVLFARKDAVARQLDRMLSKP